MPPLYFLTRHIVPCYCLILVVYLLCFVTINNYLLQYSIFLEQAIASAPGPIWHETESESGFMTISLFGNAAWTSSLNASAAAISCVYAISRFIWLPSGLLKRFSNRLHGIYHDALCLLYVRAFANASSFSPWIWSTGLSFKSVPRAAAAGVILPPFLR